MVEKGRVVSNMVEGERALAEKREVERRRRKKRQKKKKGREKSFFQFNSIIHENCIYMHVQVGAWRMYNQRIL